MKFQTILLHDFYNTFFRKPQCWGQFCNYGNQIGQQIGYGYGGIGWGWGRKKRSAQFNNWGSQIGQQISGGYGGGWGGFGGYRGYGGGQFNNWGSQIGQQIGRKKRSAQGFRNVGSQIGQQIDQSQNFNFGRMSSMEALAALEAIGYMICSITIKYIIFFGNVCITVSALISMDVTCVV